MHALRIAHTLTLTLSWWHLMHCTARFSTMLIPGRQKQSVVHVEAKTFFQQRWSLASSQSCGISLCWMQKKRKKMTSMNIILCRPSNPVQESLCEGDAETCFPVLFETSSWHLLVIFHKAGLQVRTTVQKSNRGPTFLLKGQCVSFSGT